jgi:hypothetical protein
VTVHTFPVAFNTTGISSGLSSGIVIKASADKPVHIEVSAVIVTAFNAVTTNVLTVGTSSTATELLPAQAITEGTAGVYPTNTLKTYTTLGRNGAGAITVTGAQVGDIVTGVVGTTAGTLGDLSAGFETTITVADQIQQTSATDYSAKALFITLTRNPGTGKSRLTSDTTIWAKYTQTGTAATTGAAVIIVKEFQENTRAIV